MKHFVPFPALTNTAPILAVAVDLRCQQFTSALPLGYYDGPGRRPVHWSLVVRGGDVASVVTATNNDMFDFLLTHVPGNTSLPQLPEDAVDGRPSSPEAVLDAQARMVRTLLEDGYSVVALRAGWNAANDYVGAVKRAVPLILRAVCASDHEVGTWLRENHPGLHGVSKAPTTTSLL